MGYIGSLSSIKVFRVEREVNLFPMLITGSSQDKLRITVLEDKLLERLLVSWISLNQEIFRLG